MSFNNHYQAPLLSQYHGHDQVDHKKNEQQQQSDLSINVGSGLSYTSEGRDMHNRCCSGRYWCIQDICGIICAIFTWLLILYSMFVSFSVILFPALGRHPLYAAFNLLLFSSLAFLAFFSHIRTMLTDPVI